MIQSELFYCGNKYTSPPFKRGLYLEEYFLQKMLSENPVTKRIYIPSLWTNFQLEHWFHNRKQKMQQKLDEWLINNPSEHGYFTIVQYDDGPLLKLPENTTIYGACSGNIPIPLIYQDTNNTLINLPKKAFSEKTILCSFIGNINTNHVMPNVRLVLFEEFHNNPNFCMISSGGSSCGNQSLQQLFIDTTIHSKFALAPRGYGRGSFRFFECFQLGTIPIYIWNDIEWLPFQNKIDYSRLCISIHVSELHGLENKLLSISEAQYNEMFSYYNEIKHLFELEGMYKQIIEENLTQ